ncbi:hypothetical protein [Streptomyces sp. NPDC052721]|uniref:hypothetical protein n=1 Tax=Streptomyces sp. NPDC052721 TaxID=3154955 RepID=UPI00342A8E5D
MLVWIIKPGDTSPEDSKSSIRDELTRSAALLRGAPALHYTGTIKVKEQGNARLDLVVDNPGDALGTLAMADGPALDYVAVDGKSFLRGKTEAWQSIGMDKKSKVLAEHPRLVAPGVFFGKDLATALAPPALAKTLLLEHTPDEKITVGDPVTVGDHTCTPLHADGMTICLGKRSQGGARFVDRVSFPGGTLVIDIKAMSRKAINEFSGDFQSKLTMTREAVNDQIDVTTQILRDYKGDCAPTACTFTARVTVTYLGSSTAPEASKAVQVNYAWVIDRDGTPVTVGPDCSGTVLIKPGQSTNMACTATGPSVPANGPNSGAYHGEIHTSDVALTQAEYKRLVRLAADHSKKVTALPDLPPPR